MSSSDSDSPTCPSVPKAAKSASGKRARRSRAVPLLLPSEVLAVACASSDSLPVVQVQPSATDGMCITATRDTWASVCKAFHRLLRSPKFLGDGVRTLAPEESHDTLATLYGLVEDATLACNPEACVVYRLMWQAVAADGSHEAYHADVVVDDTDGGSGLGFVFRTGFMFVKGPRVKAVPTYDDARASAVSTSGQVHEVTPAALCHLQVFCDLIRVVVAKRARKPHWLSMDVTVNTVVDGDALAASYRSVASRFASSVLCALFPQAVDAPGVPVPNRGALLDSLRRLCVTLRCLGVSRLDIKAQTHVWVSLAKTPCPPCPLDGTVLDLGVPTCNDGVESALQDLARDVLACPSWTPDMVQDQEAFFLACAYSKGRLPGNTTV